MRPLIFNGKFYSGAINGVHRVADQLIREVDRLLCEMPPARRPAATLLLPRRRKWTPNLHAITIREQAFGHTQAWEQLILPFRARGSVLINLCNFAPLLARRRIILLHDAQFLFPDSSYPLRQRWGHRLLSPRMMRGSRVALTVSQYSRQIIDLTGICPRERVGILYNGSDHILEAVSEPGTLGQWDLAPATYVVLFGSTKRYKNVQVLFDAFQSRELADLKLVVIGQGRAEHAAAGIAAPPNAVFVGYIGDNGLRALYENAACLAVPSRTEGFGLPPVEAMRLGCPTIVAPAGAMPEVCRDATCYADVDKPEEWVRAIRALCDDATHRADKIRAGLQRSAEFTWQQSGVRLLEMALTLAGRPETAPVPTTRQGHRSKPRLNPVGGDARYLDASGHSRK